MKRTYIIWVGSIAVAVGAALITSQLQIKILGDKITQYKSELTTIQSKMKLLERRDSVLLDSFQRMKAERLQDSNLLVVAQQKISETVRHQDKELTSYNAPSTQSTDAASVSNASNKNVLSGKQVAIKGITLNGGACFDVFKVSPGSINLEIYHRIDNRTGGSIQALKSMLRRQSKKLVFATNGGMFEKNMLPVGLYVENGQEIYPLNLAPGGDTYTNFYSLPPNGVFYITKGKTAGIVKKEDYAQINSDLDFATQSGPMAVINGKINPQFQKKSTSKFIRSGVGVRKDGSVLFAISQHPVNFYDFARIFLFYGCQDALYLDGAISEMYLPEINRNQSSNEFALLIAVTEKM